MKKYTVVALSLAVLLMTSGCSKDDDSSNSGSDTTQKTKYEGVWDATDSSDPLDVVTFTIQGTTLNMEVSYADVNITSHASGTGNFSIDGTKEVQPNNITVDKVTHTIVTCNASLTPLTADTVTGLNASNECGGGWTVNVAKDTSDCKRNGDPKTVCEYIKENGKTIFHLDGNKIYLGDDNATDSDGYPEALGTDFWIKK